MIKNKKNIQGYELKKEYGKRNYGKKEEWKFAEIVLIMETGDDINATMEKTKRAKGSVRFMIDGIYNEIGKRFFGFEIGFKNNTKMFKKAFETADVHKSFYESAAKRIGPRIKEMRKKIISFEMLE